MAQPLDAKIDSLEEFREVNILNPAVGDVLRYNGWEWRNAAASAGSGPTTKRVATNLSYAASTTISDFTFAAAANKTYLAQGLLVVTQSNETSLSFDVDGPSGFSANGTAIYSGSSGASESCVFDESGTVVTMPLGPTGGAEAPLPFHCIVRTSSTAGDVSFDIATDSGAGTNLLLAGSSITITEIA